MIIIKTPEEINRLREGGMLLAEILKEVAKAATPGITTGELEALARQEIKKVGDTPAFLNYKPEGAAYPFPAALCVSINAEVVHGIPRNDRVLKEGDIVSLDLGLNHKGVFLDHAITVPVGSIGKKDKELLQVTKDALEVGIEAIIPGATVGDIGYAIEQYVKPYHFGIIRSLSGHGVGRAIHEDPYIPNYGKKGRGAKLVPGMVIAIEPMLSHGSEDVRILDDGYTLKTTDNSRAAHFEHTVLVTEVGAEVLTK